ncbi:MAG: nucleotidyl transferase AbiEii/AbiGii toxin family protein [Candidatus Tumulicola sp.]
MPTRITEGHLALHYYKRNDSRNPALLDVGQDHALQILHQHGLFAEGLVFKGGTALRKVRAGSSGRFSTDLDFAVSESGVAQRRAVLHMQTPFGVPVPPARIDIAHRLPWLAPDLLSPIALPIHPG